jgi:hypothetical protein
MNRKSPINRFLTAVLALSLAACLTSCNIPTGQNIAEATDRAVNVLDDGISALANESSDWRLTLEGMVNKLTDDAQSTIRHEISDLMNRSVAAAGAEAKCLADFARTRVRQGLISIRAVLLGAAPEETEPVFCDAVPRILERAQIPVHTNVLEFFGYDFDRSNIRMLLVKASGSSVDVTDKMERPTHYHMTLNLGANGVQITPDSQRIVVRWNDKDLSSVGIVRDSPRVCRTWTTTVAFDAARTVTPVLTRGDREFYGHGPRIMVNTTRHRTLTNISVNVTVAADETNNGDTKAYGTQSFTVITAAPDQQIERVLGPANDVLSPPFIDKDHNQQTEFRGSGGPVDRYVIDGDRDGDDVEVHTKVTVFLNPMKVVLKERGDCVSATEGKAALQRGQLSEKLDRTIRPQLDAVPPDIKSIPEASGNTPG